MFISDRTEENNKCINVDDCSEHRANTELEEHSSILTKHRIRRALEHPNQLEWTGA